MPLFTLASIIIVIGVLLYLVNRFIPMEPSVKSILNAVVIVALVLFILNLFLPAHLANIRIGS